MNAVDTNILVYAVDQSEPVKRPIALELLQGLSAKDTILLWQVLCEFAAVMVRIYQQATLRLSPLDIIGAMQKRFPLVMPTSDWVETALRLRRDASISFWDAMLVPGCAAAGADQLFTEDLSHGATILGVRIINPFK